MAILNDTPRIPPQNIEAEQAVLGAILSDNKNLERYQTFCCHSILVMQFMVKFMRLVASILSIRGQWILLF